MDGKFVTHVSIFWITLCVSNDCAFAQSKDSVYANFKVSLGWDCYEVYELRESAS